MLHSRPSPLAILTLVGVLLGRPPAEMRGTQHGRRVALGTGVVVFGVAALVLLATVPTGQAATPSVNCDKGGSLQSKINAAASGSTILVKGTCAGNFQIQGKSLSLKGNPTATLDGNQAGSTLAINAAGKAIRLVGLRITGGKASFGAGIIKQAGGAGLTLRRVMVVGNQAVANTGGNGGAGILSGSGDVTLIGSRVSGNLASGTGSAESAKGGGLFVNDGDLTIEDSVISGNTVSAKPSSGNADAQGAGFYLSDGNLTMHGATISGNHATASGTGNSADADGGGGFHTKGSSASVTNSVITANRATAVAPAGDAVVAGTGLDDDGALRVKGSTLSANVSTATGAKTLVVGGGVSADSLVLTRSTVKGNRLIATSTGGVAAARGGGIANHLKLTVTASTIARNAVTTKTSSPSGSLAQGAGATNDNNSIITNSTIALNKLTATSPPGGASTIRGAGLLSGDGSSMVNSTVAGNTTAGSGGTVSREGGGLFAFGSLTLKDTILASNTATKAPDCWGAPRSGGHNLIRNPTGCLFSSKGTDKMGKNPKLRKLKRNGGPTQTMALARTSPARNAIPKTACAVARDQRGVRRPQGKRCDIGAYERKAR